MIRRHLTAVPALLLPGGALAQRRPVESSPANLPAPTWRGANLVQTAQAPLGGAEARRAMRLLMSLGADSVAFTPYLWQPAAGSADVVRGSDTPDSALLPGIRQARELGLRVLVKPHL